MEEIWNKYKEENLQMSTYMFNLHEKEYKKIFFDAFSLGEQSKTENRKAVSTKFEKIVKKIRLSDVIGQNYIIWDDYIDDNTYNKLKNLGYNVVENFHTPCDYYYIHWDKEFITNIAEKELEQKEKINRVEVIQKDKGRVYTNYNVKSCEIQEQDNGETLKIFLDYER